MDLKIKRIHEPSAAGDGTRFLVDRLWPRGVSKEKAALDAWLKAISPSDRLRKTYHGETADSDEAWMAFRIDYAGELNAAPAEALAALATLEAALAEGLVTLLYAARNEERNNAVALKDWLEQR